MLRIKLSVGVTLVKSTTERSLEGRFQIAHKRNFAS